MVCFVFTAYPSIGEAVDMDEGSKTEPTLEGAIPLKVLTPPNKEGMKDLLAVEDTSGPQDVPTVGKLGPPAEPCGKRHRTLR